MKAPLRLPLPPHFTSLYRLFLRAVSASVLHKPIVARRLRRVWRPTFREAAKVVKDLQQGNIGEKVIKEKEIWFNLWNERNKTLAILVTSSTSRGLPHNLTRNLSSLFSYHLQWIDRRNRTMRRVWDPSLPPDSPLYKDISMAAKIGAPKSKAKQEKLRQHAEMAEEAWGALGEIVRLAEGKDGVCLGKVASSRRKV